jgi:hypothetical protein
MSNINSSGQAKFTAQMDQLHLKEQNNAYQASRIAEPGAHGQSSNQLYS